MTSKPAPRHKTTKSRNTQESTDKRYNQEIWNLGDLFAANKY